jgi:tRNA threonylcarbamoyladenosine biosynthesis protein TsaE
MGEAGRVARDHLTRSEAETEGFGERLARELRPESVVYLFGRLGAGKTALARGLARGLGAPAREVASPTFAILNEYASDSGGVVLRHLDLYRLKDEEKDLEVLGLPGAVSGAPVAVEWPNATIRRLLPPTAEIEIEVLPGGERRIRRLL